MKKRILSLVLTLAMVLSLIPLSAMAASPDDGYADTQGHWGEASIERWSGYGIVEGNDGMFYPNVSMNRGQAAKVYATLLGLTKMADLSGYTDVDSSAWYYEYMALCVAAGIFQGGGNGTLSPDAPMSRQEMFVTFARALGIAPVANTDVEFTDGGQIAGWAEGYINALAERGIVSGGGDGSVSPLTAIDRASVMAMLDKAVNEYVVDNGATVAASGDLVLVVADNVTVTGDVDTLVVAGGDNAVTVTGTVSNAAIVTPDNTLSVSGSAKVGNVTIPTAAENASVVVSANASVTTVTSEADNVVISGSGTVGSAVVSGNNTAVNTDGTDLTVAEGTTGVTENSKPVTGGTTVETEPQAPVTPPVHVHSYTVTEIKAADAPETTVALQYTCYAGDHTYMELNGNAQACVGNDYYVSLQNAINALENGESVILCQNVSLNSGLQLRSNFLVTIDLNHYTLALNKPVSSTEEIKANPELTNNCIDAVDGKSVLFKNGTLNFTCGNVGIYVGKGSSAVLENVDYTCNRDPFLIYQNAASLQVIGSYVKAGGDAWYGLSTNAATPDNYNVSVSFKDSTLDTATTAILFNIPGTLNIESSTIKGAFHGVIARGGDVTIKDSTIDNQIDPAQWADPDYSGAFLDSNWGSGNSVPLNALVVGNRSSSAYQYPAHCTLTNTDITVGEGQRTVYVYGNATEDLGAYLTYDENSNVGDVIVGGGYVKINGNQAVYDANGLQEVVNNGISAYLACDISLNQYISIAKSVTIDGAGHKLTVEDGVDRVINITGTTDPMAVSLKNLDMIGPTTGTYTRGISLYDADDVTLTLDNCSLSANYYAINVASANTNPIIIAHKSTIKGWCAFQTHSPYTQATFEECTLIGLNDKAYSADGWNGFASLVINGYTEGNPDPDGAHNSTLTFVNCRIEANQTTGNAQYLLSVRAKNTTVNAINCTYVVDGVEIPANDELGQHISVYDEALDTFEFTLQ